MVQPSTNSFNRVGTHLNEYSIKYSPNSRSNKVLQLPTVASIAAPNFTRARIEVGDEIRFAAGSKELDWRLTRLARVQTMQLFLFIAGAPRKQSLISMKFSRELPRGWNLWINFPFTNPDGCCDNEIIHRLFSFHLAETGRWLTGVGVSVSYGGCLFFWRLLFLFRDEEYFYFSLLIDAKRFFIIIYATLLLVFTQSNSLQKNTEYCSYYCRSIPCSNFAIRQFHKIS